MNRAKSLRLRHGIFVPKRAPFFVWVVPQIGCEKRLKESGIVEINPSKITFGGNRNYHQYTGRGNRY